MAQKLTQTQTATQTQTLTPLQVTLVKMLELPLTDMEERVRNEMLENSALEEGNSEDSENNNEDDGRNEDEDSDPNLSADTDEAIGDYLTEDDIPDYLQARADADRERHEIPLTGGDSFYDSLRDQIGEHDLSEHEQELMEYLIGSLDSDGFLRKDLDMLADELAIYHNISTTKEELEKLLGILQTFEPRGIGARSLQECLRLQLKDPDNRSPYKKLSLEVIDRCFDDFIHKRWDTIMKRLGIDEETFNHVKHELTHLNPQPGSALNEGGTMGAPTVIPDFYVSVDDNGQATVSLNSGDIPDLRVSPAFKDSIKEYSAHKDKLNRQQKDAYVYAKQKVDAAQTFIDILHRRQQTLYSVMHAIVQLQRPFFDEDDEMLLKPMTLKDIAERTGLDISTVSRVTGSKYVQTDYGIYPLKFFFSGQFTSEKGEEQSSRLIKATLREIVEKEDKKHPLSDEAIAAKLKEKGFNVARRTVAKYREQIGIPTARMRR